MEALHVFLGANSGRGFYSLYDQMLGGRFDDLMILKGGPGCGKSTFMRLLAQKAQERGERVILIHCSGDPESLDGTIFPQRKRAVVDGTSPHGTAPLGHHRSWGEKSAHAASKSRRDGEAEKTPFFKKRMLF